MEDPVSPVLIALIGVGGVVVGGLLAVLGQFVVEWSRARAAKKSEEARQARELQLAGRLVMEELAEASALIEGAAKAWRYWAAPRKMPTDTWGEYRTAIAAAIDSPLDWRRVTRAYDAINNLNWIVEHRRSTSPDPAAPTGGVLVAAVDETRETWRAIRQAIATLEVITGVHGPASRLLREMADAEAEYWPHGDGDSFDEEDARLTDLIRRQEEDERYR